MSDEEFLDAGPEGETIDDLITLVELQQGLLSAVATGGPRIETVERTYKERRQRLKRGLRALGIDDPFPWASLWEWYGYWKNLGGWAERRRHIEQLAASALDQLEARRDVSSVVDWGEATIEGLEIRLDGLKGTLDRARTLDDFQDVGRRSREVLIDLARLVFDESMVPDGVPTPGRSDAKRRLELFFESTFAGASNEEMRRFMKGAVALANSAAHSDDTARVHAFAVAQAAVLIVRVASLLTRADPENWSRPTIST